MSDTPPPPYPPAPGPTGGPTGAAAAVPSRPENHLAFAILSMFLCCWPFSIPALIYATKVDGLYTSGRHAEAAEASAKARKWSIVSAAVSAAAVLLWIVVFAVLVALGETSAGDYGTGY